MTGPKYTRAMDVMEADIGDELVMLDVRGGTTFAFNTFAASVWRSLSNPKSFEELRDEILAEYIASAEDCSKDLRQVLKDMLAEGLIREAS